MPYRKTTVFGKHHTERPQIGRASLFTVEGMNFGVNSGEGTICKKDGAGCVVLLGQPWSHSSVVFERKPPDWTANDFPGTLSITVGDKTTPKITLVKNPPAFLNETNKALVLESKFDTNGMVDEMRASVPLTVHGVEEASLNTLVINIDMGTPVGIKSLFGCAKGATNCPSDQQGNTTDWTKLNCGYDVDFSQTFCTVLVSIPEGQGENLPLWVVYGSVQSPSIVFGGYNIVFGGYNGSVGLPSTATRAVISRDVIDAGGLRFCSNTCIQRVTEIELEP